MKYGKELEAALEAVRKASLLCRAVQDSLDLEALQKQDRSPVTVADFGGQAVICLELLKRFPRDAIVGEEDVGLLRQNQGLMEMVRLLVRDRVGEISSEQMLDAIAYGAGEADPHGRFWAVDPLDGTKGFLRREQYAVALALIEDGRPVLGVLGCPRFFPGDDAGATGSLFSAVRGEGAQMISLAGGESRPIHVDQVDDPSRAVLCESVESGHSSHETHAAVKRILGIGTPPCRMDGQVKYAAVASGAAAVYLRVPRSGEYREKIWDHAAGSIVVEEAGGRVTDFSDRPLLFSTGREMNNAGGIVATNGWLHDRVLEAIRAVVSEDRR